MFSRKYLPVILVLLTMACGLFSQTQPSAPNQATQPVASTALLATATPLPTATETITLTPTPSETATPPPTPAATDTPLPTATPTIDPQSATTAAMLGSIYYLQNMPAEQREHPVGTPLTIWHTVPIMTQATAGQELNAHIYSYIAAATLSQARQFYDSRVAALGIKNFGGTGYGGTGSQANHNTGYLSYFITIYITSYDNDTGHVIVVISSVK